MQNSATTWKIRSTVSKKLTSKRKTCSDGDFSSQIQKDLTHCARGDPDDLIARAPGAKQAEACWHSVRSARKRRDSDPRDKALKGQTALLLTRPAQTVRDGDGGVAEQIDGALTE